MKSKDLHTLELPLSPRANHVELPLATVIAQPTMSRAIALCVQVSGLDDKEVGRSLEIDPGHWTRIMNGSGHFPTDKLDSLCDLCGNEAPLQWWAHKRGKGLVLLKSEAERRAEAAEERARIAEEALRTLARAMQGHAE